MGALLVDVFLLKLMVLSWELLWAVASEAVGALVGFSAQLFWSAFWTSGDGWYTRLHPAKTPLCSQRQEDMAFVEKWGAEAPVCPRQQAELRAREVLLATSSSSKHEETEPAHGKTLGVMGSDVGAACLAPCDGP